MAKKMKTMDGNQAAAYISYAFTDVAAIYPITPSSPMAEDVDVMAAKGVKNIFGQKVRLVEMQSEAGAAGTVHGSLQAGALTTTYTASQGFLLMIPNLYKIAGELLPGVFHVSARALATSTLSIFGDHQDVMAARQTGCAMFAESSVQEVMDLSAVAHLAAIKGRIPFINFFDGFRTSHEIQKIELIDYADLAKILDFDAVNNFRRNALNPDHPVMRGTATNPDVYFQIRETVNNNYDKLPDIVEEAMADVAKITGRVHHIFDYSGAPDAERIIIAIGSGCQTANEAAAYLNAQGEKVGVVSVHLYRPFSVKHFLNAIPKTVKKIAVLDRTKESGAVGEPLYLDVKAAFYDVADKPVIVGGRFGLGGKDTTPDQMLAVFEELKKDSPMNGFTIGINDDVSNKSLRIKHYELRIDEGTTACKFWGLGSDGTVGANKSAIKIIGDNTDLYAQAYFAYDSKKSGGITMSHLRFGKLPITSPYLITKPDFVSCSQKSYVHHYNLIAGLKPNGTFLLNTDWSDEKLGKKLQPYMKRYIVENNINVYTVNAVKIAGELGLGGRFNMVMQAAFFKLANIIPIDEAVKYLKDAVEKSYGSKGQNVVDMNCGAIDKGIEALHKVDISTWDIEDTSLNHKSQQVDPPEFITDIQNVMNRQEGDELAVSKFVKLADGTFPVGGTAYEKRGTAIKVPEWDKSKCIGCNQCSFVCPHAAIRPILTTEDELKNAPEGFESIPSKISRGKYNLTIAVSTMDCLGCGNCAQVCPKQALTMVKYDDAAKARQKVFNYGMKVAPKDNPTKKTTVIGSQFEKPLFEFSGACAGCGETPYAKLLTQLFGDRMMIANATGCSSIWGASAPAMPYTKNQFGRGPAWGNSLFEDNAEYGLGMFLGVKAIRESLASDVEKAIQELGTRNSELVEALTDWKDNLNVSENTRDRADKLTALLETQKGDNELLNKIYNNRDFFVNRSQWILGGDGWAYDIGYGGLDHVLASGEDINIFVFDTEVYSNTGGQASKATPAAAIAQFAATGKRTKKKDLGKMAMSYGYVYVAQVSMGADQNQLLKAITEAEAYPGPSLIIAYSPCINHGIRKGMGSSQLEGKLAVQCGYWANWRYNPQLIGTDKNPFTLDSKEPDFSKFQEFLMGEVRYSSLKRNFPDAAQALFEKTQHDAEDRINGYKILAGK